MKSRLLLSSVYLCCTSAAIAHGGTCSVVDTSSLANRPASVDYTNLEITGLDRVNKDVVVNLLVFRKDGKLDIDESIKAVYRSGIFSDISIKMKSGKVYIHVHENPSIEKLRFEGNDHVKDDMLKTIIGDRLAEGKMFNKATIQDIVGDIQSAYRFSGFPGAVINPKYINRPGNKVDIVIEISEGEQALVSKVIFCGNKVYDKEVLKDKIETKERATWRILNKEVSIFGLEKTRIDTEALNRFYHDEGYLDFKVNKIVPELDFKKRNTYLTIMLSEGSRFKVNNVGIISNVPNVSVSSLKCDLPIKEGHWCSKSLIEVSRMLILERLSKLGHVFVDVKYDLRMDRKANEVGILYAIVSTPRHYIERIEIDGNSRTEDAVIRRAFKFHEGDPHCAYDVYKAKENLLATGFFSDVSINVEKGSSNDRIILKVSVKESEETSAISFACTASDAEGFGGTIAYNDINFLGRGQTFSSDIQVAQKMITGTVSLFEPRFLWDNVAGEIEFGGAKRNRKRQESSDYKEVHIMPSIIYNINPNLSHRLSCCLMFSRKVWVDKDGKRHNTIPKEEAGKTFLEDEFNNFSSSEISSTITYRNATKTKNGTTGYSISLRNAYSGLFTNTVYFKNSLSGEYFTPCTVFDNQTIFMVRANISHIHESKNGRSCFRYQPTGDGQSFRGFDTVSPREKDSGDCIGGLNMWSVSAQLRRPITGSELGVFASAFVDIGSVWGVPSKYKGKKLAKAPTNTIYDSSAPRISIGFAIEWKKCPLGTPLSFIFAAPLKKCKHDVRRAFTLGM